MDILLLEPAYKNKYPPLGLMKLATFHKERGDKVTFAKGSEQALPQSAFDRVYINSLFTFEWPKTRKAIDFAYKCTNDKRKIYLGGITATIMTEFVRQEAPEINIITGLLDTAGKIGLPQDGEIDTLAPDYSILEQIEYSYPAANDYIIYSTRGCGMNCSFCAVQRLEPVFVEYICIKKQIQAIRERNGEKCNLLLMDNNVLKSPKFETIIEDIIELGFAKGAKFVYDKAKRPIKRYVDFNQGLDANFLTQEKAVLLAKLELRPVRIAFDHITQTKKYLKAVQLCFAAGLRNFSNYLLYNSGDAVWKGQVYKADTPVDLYNRLKINVMLCEHLQKKLKARGAKESVSIYSFPMRYIPLSDTKRGYVGTHWNKKHLRAIQVFITPTQGKGVASKTFFNASFGRNLQEFLVFIDMPENLLARRGIYIENKKHTAAEKLEKLTKVKFNQALIQEWRQLYDKLVTSGLWPDFATKYIHCNSFPLEVLYSIQEPLLKEMFLYYVSAELINKNINKMPDREREFIYKTFIQPTKYLSKLFSI